MQTEHLKTRYADRTLPYRTADACSHSTISLQYLVEVLFITQMVNYPLGPYMVVSP
jgi:hypothetical protein